MDCSPPGSSVHGIFQARMLEWVAISFSRGSSQPRQPWALSLPDKELCLREALAVCTPPAPEPSAKRPGS